MLVVSRKSGEAIDLSQGGKPLGSIQIVRLGDGRVRVGLDFPRDVEIDRREVTERKQRELAAEAAQ